MSNQTKRKLLSEGDRVKKRGIEVGQVMFFHDGLRDLVCPECGSIEVSISVVSTYDAASGCLSTFTAYAELDGACHDCGHEDRTERFIVKARS